MKKNYLVDGFFDVLGSMIYCVFIMYRFIDMIDVVYIILDFYLIL